MLAWLDRKMCWVSQGWWFLTAASVWRPLWKTWKEYWYIYFLFLWSLYIYVFYFSILPRTLLTMLTCSVFEPCLYNKITQLTSLTLIWSNGGRYLPLPMIIWMTLSKNVKDFTIFSYISNPPKRLPFPSSSNSQTKPKRSYFSANNKQATNFLPFNRPPTYVVWPNKLANSSPVTNSLP